MKMKQVDLIRLEDEIRQLLIDDEQARNDDMYLYWKYCYMKMKLIKEGFATFESFFVSKDTREKYKIKCYHSVSRCRRKIQEKTPELASERTKRLRAKEESTYKDYSRM